MSSEEIARRIKAKLPDAEIDFTDLAGDGDHWQATIVSSAFSGLPRVRQHQLIYDALGTDMGTTLHAFSFKTVTRPA
ncbi:MAG: BolA/IbaG family iron-sulfur metabolism protein [Rickettsiales bacterium]